MAKGIRYTDGQKRDALSLMADIGGKAASEQLGISLNTLYKWRREQPIDEAPAQEQEQTQEKAPANDAVESLLKREDLADVDELTAENERLRAEADALRAQIARLRDANAKLKDALRSLLALDG